MAANCNYKVKLIGALDMLRFKNMPKVREAAIQAAPATPLPKTLTTNEKAKVRHPESQRVVVAEIRQNGPDVKTIVLRSEDGAPLFSICCCSSCTTATFSSRSVSFVRHCST